MTLDETIQYRTWQSIESSSFVPKKFDMEQSVATHELAKLSRYEESLLICCANASDLSNATPFHIN